MVKFQLFNLTEKSLPKVRRPPTTLVQAADRDGLYVDLSGRFSGTGRDGHHFQVIITRVPEKVNQVFAIVGCAAEQRGAHLQCGQPPPARGDARRHLG